MRHYSPPESATPRPIMHIMYKCYTSSSLLVTCFPMLIRFEQNPRNDLCAVRSVNVFLCPSIDAKFRRTNSESEVFSSTTAGVHMDANVVYPVTSCTLGTALLSGFHGDISTF